MNKRGALSRLTGKKNVPVYPTHEEERKGGDWTAELAWTSWLRPNQGATRRSFQGKKKKRQVAKSA